MLHNVLELFMILWSKDLNTKSVAVKLSWGIYLLLA